MTTAKQYAENLYYSFYRILFNGKSDTKDKFLVSSLSKELAKKAIEIECEAKLDGEQDFHRIATCELESLAEPTNTIYPLICNYSEEIRIIVVSAVSVLMQNVPNMSYNDITVEVISWGGYDFCVITSCISNREKFLVSFSKKEGLYKYQNHTIYDKL